MSLRDGLTGYYANFGLRGVLAISAYRLFGRPKEITAHPPGLRNPVHIRMRTTDAATYAEVLLRGEYAFDLPRSPRTIVDAGANIGMASIFFAHRYPEARVIAIEAEPSNFGVLARNVRPYPAIIPLHAALWNRDGEISVSEPDPATGAAGKCGFVTHEGSGLKVRAITMRTLMTEMQIHTIDVLKMDIEGAEKEVFEVCDWMDDVRCLMIGLHDRFKRDVATRLAPLSKDCHNYSGAKQHYICETNRCEMRAAQTAQWRAVPPTKPPDPSADSNLTS